MLIFNAELFGQWRMNKCSAGFKLFLVWQIKSKSFLFINIL